MKIGPEIIYRVLISLFAVFIVGKVLGVIFASWATNRKEKKRNVDLDLMIENKKSLLRASSGLNKSEGNQSGKASKTKTEEAYKKTAIKDSNQSETCLEVLKLIEDLQWGDGKAFSEIQSYMDSHWELTVDTPRIANIFNGLLVRDTLLSLPQEKLPDKTQILQILKARLFCEALLEDSKTNTILQTIAKKLNLQEWTARKSIELALASAIIPSNDKLYATILNPKGLKGITPGKKQELIAANFLTADNKHLLTIDLLVSRIKKYAETIAPLRPLPLLKGKADVEGAFKVMGLEVNASKDEIKSCYKKLASQLHPDRLSGMKLGPEMEKVANENFSTLQQAFDILKKQA